MTEEPSQSAPVPPIQPLPPVAFELPGVAYPRQSEVPRYPFGWIGFWIIFLFLILTAGYGYFSRKPSDPDRLTQVEVSFEFAVATSRSKAARGSDAVSKILPDLAKVRKKDAAAARMYLVVAHEAGRKVSAADLVYLGTKPLDKAYNDLYMRDHLTVTEANRLRSVIGKDRFSERVARAHALEKAGDPSARKNLVSPWKLPALGLVAILGFIAVLGSLAAWIYFIQGKATGTLTPLGFAAGNMSLGLVDRFAGRAAQAIALGLLFLPYLAHKIFEGYGAAATSFATGAASIGTVVVLSYMPIGGKRITLESIGVNTKNLGKNILWGIGGFCANIPLVMLALLLGLLLFSGLPSAEHPITKELQGLKNPLSIASIFFLAAVVAPIYEEIVFRGHIFPAFSRIMGTPLRGAIASSFLFAAVHPTGIPAWLGLATVGAMNCFLAYQRKSLVPAIVLHAIHNAALLTLTLVVF